VDAPERHEAVIARDDGEILEIRAREPDADSRWVWGAFKLDGAVLAGLSSGEDVVPARPEPPQSAETAPVAGGYTPNRQNAFQATARAAVGDIINRDGTGDWDFIPGNAIGVRDARGHVWTRNAGEVESRFGWFRTDGNVTFSNFEPLLIRPLEVTAVGHRPRRNPGAISMVRHAATMPDETFDVRAAGQQRDLERARMQLDAVRELAEARLPITNYLTAREVLDILGDPYTPPATSHMMDPLGIGLESDTKTTTESDQDDEPAGPADATPGRADSLDPDGFSGPERYLGRDFHGGVGSAGDPG